MNVRRKTQEKKHRENIFPKSNVIKLRTDAIRLLARREHSCHELQIKLRARGYDDLAISLVLQQLAAEDLQSDRRFVEAYLRMRIAKGYGLMRIMHELRERGVGEILIEECLAMYSSCFWLEHLKKVRHKRFGAAIPKEPELRAKQIRFLLYRGFSAEQINFLFKNDTNVTSDEKTNLSRIT